MIKLRLRRMGAKRQPSYRIVAADSRSPRDGRFIEIVGFYNPKPDPYELRVNVERAKYWLDHGAQPTETVRSLLVKSGVLPGRDGTYATQPESQTTAEKVSSDEPAPAASDSDETTDAEAAQA